MPVPTIDLRVCPITKDEATSILGEPAIGFKAITESGPICHEGCMAPGSSPHSHLTITQWMLVGETCIAWVDAETGLCMRAAVLHNWRD